MSAENYGDLEARIIIPGVQEDWCGLKVEYSAKNYDRSGE